MNKIKNYLPKAKHTIILLVSALLVAIGFSLIPVTDTEGKAARTSSYGLGVVYEKTGQQPNYISPQFKLFSIKGETIQVFFGGEVQPTCLDYPDLIAPKSDHGRPFAAFEVRDIPYCNLSIFFMPVAFALNYAVVLVLIGAIWLIIAHKRNK